MLYENEYWRIEFDASNEHAIILDSLYDDKGNLVERDMPIPSRFFVTMRRKGVLADYLRVADPDAKLIFSERAALVVRQETRCCESISWVPVDVLNRKREKIADYQVPFRPTPHVVLDYVRSQYRYCGNTEVIDQIDHWVLDGSALPPLDLFYCEQFQWLATHKFRETLESHGFTGFEFLPASVWR